MRSFLIALSLLFLMTSDPLAAQKSVKPGKPQKNLSNYVAIFDFDIVGKLDHDISRPLSDSVRNVIVKSGRFKVMDRANMDRILKEQAFQMTGSVLKERAVEAGQFLGVGKIIIGSIGIVGKTYFISLSLVNIESGETERVEEDTCKCELDELIESTKRVANKLITVGPAPVEMPIAEPAPAPKPAPKPAPEPLPERVEPLPQEPVYVAPPSGVTYKDPVTGMEFVLIKGGCFQMGDEEGDREERPVHEVCVSNFYLGRYEVTQGQWKALMGKNPSKNKNSDRDPVEDVSWNDVEDFIKELNQKTGRNYRLPTEAEWEYAARSGGRKYKWAGTNNESDLANFAWYNDNSSRDHRPVGQKRPNAYGLYDMTGNVAEWVADVYDSGYYKESPRMNPVASGRGDRVYRGGSFKDRAKDARTTKREKKSNRRADQTIGFRLALPAR